MSLHEPSIFNSPTHPGRHISYLHLNSGAAYTLLFCYGAADSSLVLNIFESFLASHPDLSLLAVDRWTQGVDVARSGEQIFSELSQITLELLHFLKIVKIAIAAHSAGAYQLLDLAKHAGSNEVTHLFFISTHIPAPYTDSKIMKWMCTMPTPVFRSVTKLDSSLGNSWIGKALVSALAKEDDRNNDNGLIAPRARQKFVYQHTRTQIETQKAGQERLDIDYRVGYERFEGITNDTLTEYYKNCAIKRTKWFTTNGEVFFGPESVRRIVADIQKGDDWDIVVVPEGTHADIYLRLYVWQRIYSEMTSKK